VDESGGLQHPAGMALGPDGWLYVSSFKTNAILRYHAVTGAFVDAVVRDAQSGLQAPGLLLFGPDQRLYVSSLGTQEILRFDAMTGAFVDVYMITGGSSEGQTHPPSLVFGQQAPSDQPGVVAPSGGADSSQRH
jgi:streptogramin lyase